jgi:hypothetical protein
MLGGAGKEKDDFTSEKVAEYTEQILEMPAAESQPKKATRAYKVAKETDFGTKQLKSGSYEGKTVTFEKKGSEYTHLIDGKEPTGFEQFSLHGEMKDPHEKKMLEVLLPSQPVKLGETWNIPAGKLLEAMDLKGADVDEAKSKLTGKLTRVYTQDGKQKGIIEVDVHIEVKPGKDEKGKRDKGGSFNMTGTIDLVIDGSVFDTTTNMTVKLGSNDMKETPGVGVTLEKSIKPAK